MDIATRLNAGLRTAVEQALYSLGAIAADEYDEGNLERAKLLHACTATLSSAIPRWVPVTERMPASGQTVLACYCNSHGNWRRICAEWIAAKTQESGSESDIGQYDETTDTYYDPEGWYEKMDNWDQFTSLVVHEGEVTYWMLMPAPPALSIQCVPANFVAESFPWD